MLHAGIIGCGGISAVHARVIKELGNAELTACADIIPERAARYGSAVYTDYLQMLDTEKLDVVHLCTPHYLHPIMTEEAARRGVAVFTEKPPAIDAAGWERIRQAAQRVPIGVCFQNRYHPHIQTCMRFLRENTYGNLKGIRGFVTWNRTEEYYAAADWKGKWATEGGGVMINQAVHTLDLIISFLGEPDQAEVSLCNHHLRGMIEVEDTAEIYLKKGNVPALLYASNAYSQDAPVMIELHFEQAVIRLEGDVLSIIQDGKKQEICCETDPIIGRSYWGAGHKECICDFYSSLENGTSYQNDIASCEATMKTLLRLYSEVD